MVGIARRAVVPVGYVVHRLRRIPGMASVLRHGSMVVVVLVAAAAIAFMLWASQVAPQRVGLADLVQARLSHMQTWIIVAGDVTGGEFLNGTYRYVLTDPGVPNAQMNVLSEVHLPLGRVTLSGTYVGGVESVPVGFRWIGTMRADPVLASDPGPPWVAIVLTSVAVFIGLSGRFTYPAFFGETPTEGRPVAATLTVGVRRSSSTSAGPIVPGTLRLRPNEPVALKVSGGSEQPLRLYSARASVEVGTLQSLSASEPALRVHQPTGDTDIIFLSTRDRDSAYSALAADSSSGAAAQTAASPARTQA